MREFVMFVIGMLLMYLILQKPLKITIHHVNETIVPDVDDAKLKELEQKMLKEDPQNDNLYEQLDETIREVNDIMGGSDR